MAYGERTDVPVFRSVNEILTMLRKAGAERLGQAETPGRIAIQCFLHDRLLRFAVDQPVAWGADGLSEAKAAQRCRQRARALMLVVKAKLESVESGVESFEEAFLPNVVMPDGKTIYEHAAPAIESGYLTGKTPQLMLGAD